MILFFIPALVQADDWYTTIEGCQVWIEDSTRRLTGVVTWSGDCVDGKASGYGEIIWTVVVDGERATLLYTGEKHAGKAHGQGSLHYWNGDRYEGQWQDGYQHGQGTYYWTNGRRYEGQWQDNKMHGQGKIFLANGDRYAGQWQDDNSY